MIRVSKKIAALSRSSSQSVEVSGSFPHGGTGWEPVAVQILELASESTFPSRAFLTDWPIRIEGRSRKYHQGELLCEFLEFVFKFQRPFRLPEDRQADWRNRSGQRAPNSIVSSSMKMAAS